MLFLMYKEYHGKSCQNCEYEKDKERKYKQNQHSQSTCKY